MAKSAESGANTGASAAEMTIDELAARTGVPSRTIRFYQSRGVLMDPEKRGRIAIYGPSHVARLELIAHLRGRGLRIDAIRGLTERIDQGELDVGEWLGLEQQLTTSWSADAPRTQQAAELRELLGSRHARALPTLLESGLLKQVGPETFLVQSPALLSIALDLDAAGIDLQTSVAAGRILHTHLGRAVAELSELLLQRAREGAIDLAGQGQRLQSLRSVATDAVRLLFAKQVEAGIRRMLESGRLTERSGHARRKRGSSRRRRRRGQ